MGAEDECGVGGGGGTREKVEKCNGKRREEEKQKIASEWGEEQTPAGKEKERAPHLRKEEERMRGAR